MKTKVYPVRQAVWGADHPYTCYFRNKEERDYYMRNHDYCDALRARTMEMEEHEFYYISGTYEKPISGGINVYPYHNRIKKEVGKCN